MWKSLYYLERLFVICLYFLYFATFLKVSSFFMSDTRNRAIFEVVSLLGAAITACLFIIPIYLSSHNYSFYFSNFIFIFCFITFTRYIFFLKYSIFSHYTPIKLAFIFVTIPVAVLLTDQFSVFQDFSDTYGLQEFVTSLKGNQQSGMIAYIRNQMLFFGAGSVVATIFLAFRMIISIWRVKNRNSV